MFHLPYIVTVERELAYDICSSETGLVIVLLCITSHVFRVFPQSCICYATLHFLTASGFSS